MTVYDPTKRLPKKALREITLAHGGHTDRSNGLCIMEVVAWLAGQPHSDRPPCVSPVIGSFLRSWNDDLDTDERQMLKPYAARVLNTETGAKDDEVRAWLVTDWLVREYAPAWLRLAGLTEHAETLERLAALTNAKRAMAAQPKIAAAWDAAWDAAGDAAGAAAGDAAGDAARAAAGYAARAAARAAAWDAARAAAGDAAGYAARAAAGYAAWDAARAALAHTTKALQKSALLLLDRMISVGKDQR